VADFDVVHRGDTTYLRRARSSAVARDEHSLARYQAGCRCARCRAARRRYDREYYALRQVLSMGAVNRRVPAGRAARALEVLRARGWSVEAIARAVGCHSGTLWRILRSPTNRCWSTIEARLVALAR
jgi:hypothetical protein